MGIPARSHGTRRVRAQRSFVSRELLLPAERYIHNEIVSAVMLFLSALAALIWANSPWSAAYHQFRTLTIGIDVAGLEVREDLHHWVNDGLMAIFFFVVGLEVKRELVRGDLSSLRRATLPVAAAAGGMILPASLYLLLTWGGEEMRGWGIPMATDVAFALGALALLGGRIPSELRILLLAIAVVDDIGAILVIAFFYTESLSGTALLLAAGVLGLLLLLTWGGVVNVLLYVTTSIVFWVAVLKSGVHATIAGVVLGAITPGRSWFSLGTYVESAQGRFRQFQEALASDDHETAGMVLGQVEELTRGTEPPLDRFERMVHPWVSYIVLPLFALVNAGVTFGERGADVGLGLVFWAVLTGLLAGKAAGIPMFTWAAVRLGLATLPESVRWSHVIGLGLLGGIGFTVALFITTLAFTDASVSDQAKTAILCASAVAGVAGYAILRFVTPAD